MDEPPAEPPIGGEEVNPAPPGVPLITQSKKTPLIIDSKLSFLSIWKYKRILRCLWLVHRCRIRHLQLHLEEPRREDRAIPKIHRRRSHQKRSRHGQQDGRRTIQPT